MSQKGYLIVEARVSPDEYSGGHRITAEKLMTLAEARGRFAKRLHLSLNGQASQERAAEKLKSLLTPHRNGACPVRLSYRNQNASADIALSPEWRVNLDDTLIASLKDWLTPDNVKVIYA